MKIQKVIEKEAESFYKGNIPEALEACLESGCRPMYMPELIDTRIDVGKGHEVWQKWYTTPSAVITGFDDGGKKTVVYAHCENWLSNPENIRSALSDKDFGERTHWGAKIPREEFNRLLEMGRDDAEDVFVVDYNELMKSKSGWVSVKKALKHPQVIPFLGGEERATQYLEKHKKVYGSDIGVWHTDDLKDEPMGRLLFLGFGYYSYLFGDYYLYDIGRFFGVRGSGATVSGGAADASAEVDARKIELPYTSSDVDVARADLEKLKVISDAFGAEKFPIGGIDELLKKL